MDKINQYLSEIYKDATARNYRFDKNKIDWKFKPANITVTNGQLRYEVTHLLRKLKARDINKFKELKNKENHATLEMFSVIKGGIEEWEVIS